LPRLIRAGDFRLESFIDGNLLVLSHRDVPGIIGYIGQVLGKAQINIAQMAVGRASRTPGGPAIGVLNLDSDVPADLLAAIARHPDVETVRLLRLPPPDEVPDWLVA
jgi:D-3-phosphoglycerate dehydrogenase